MKLPFLTTNQNLDIKTIKNKCIWFIANITGVIKFDFF